jgi:hypothetical protein
MHAERHDSRATRLRVTIDSASSDSGTFGSVKSSICVSTGGSTGRTEFRYARAICIRPSG